MSILTELHTDLGKAVQNAEGWFEEIKAKLPAVAAVAAKYENNPIVEALENAVLPASVVAEIATLITKASDEFAKTGNTTVTTPSTSTTPAATAEPTTTGTTPAAS
jgi:hypothetical protein